MKRLYLVTRPIVTLLSEQAQVVKRLRETLPAEQVFTDDEFQAEAERRFGQFENWKFVCPHCGYVAMVLEWKMAGAEIRYAGRSCVGNWRNKPTDVLAAGGPCSYKGDELNPIRMVDERGHVVRVFALADA